MMWPWERARSLTSLLNPLHCAKPHSRLPWAARQRRSCLELSNGSYIALVAQAARAQATCSAHPRTVSVREEPVIRKACVRACPPASACAHGPHRSHVPCRLSFVMSGGQERPGLRRRSCQAVIGQDFAWKLYKGQGVAEGGLHISGSRVPASMRVGCGGVAWQRRRPSLAQLPL